MDKATTTQTGIPDYLICVRTGAKAHAAGVPRVVALGVELKMPGEQLTADQMTMRDIMEAPPNGWRNWRIESLEQLRELLRHLGI
jgi:hypothetical protein